MRCAWVCLVGVCEAGWGALSCTHLSVRHLQLEKGLKAKDSSGQISVYVLGLVAQSHPTCCDPTDCSPPDSSVHRILQARILEWVASPSPGDCSAQGLNPGLLHCQQILYHLSYQGSPISVYPSILSFPSLQRFI